MSIFESIVGDITKIEADAIVNAAKESLLGGGGVDGAIHYAAGPELVAACMPLAPCPVGEARVTPGFKLLAKFVVHTVGPIWKGGDRGEPDLLAACYRNSLAAAADVGARSVVFPGISTGIFGYPIDLANGVAVREIKLYLESNPDAFDRVSLIWLTEVEAAMARALL